MADNEKDPVTSEVEVSSAPPSPNAKDGAPPSTPSSVSTDSTSGAERNEGNQPLSGDMNAEDLPSDEEKEYAKNSNKNSNNDQEQEIVKKGSFVDGEEIPFDEVEKPMVEDETNISAENKYETISEEATTEDNQDETNDKKEETFEEDVHVTSQPESEPVVLEDETGSRAEATVETDVQAKPDDNSLQEEEPVNVNSNETPPFEPEPGISDDTKDNLGNPCEATGETIATLDVQEEIAPEEEKAKETPQNESQSSSDSDALQDGIEENIQNSSATNEEEGAPQSNAEETIPQEEQTEEYLRIDTTSKTVLDGDSGANTENVNENSGEEAIVQKYQEEVALEQEEINEPSRSESPSVPEAGTTKDGETNEGDNHNEAVSSDDGKNAESTISATKPLTLHIDGDIQNDDDHNSDEDEEDEAPAPMITPRSGGLSFAQAFSNKQLPPSLATPPLAHLPKTPSNTSPPSSTKSGSHHSRTSATDTPTSHSAISASKNKKAHGLISKYEEKVAHESLPGDSVELRNSSHKRTSFSDASPGTAKILQQKSAEGFVELNALPDMNSVRDKLEKSSRKSGGTFEFGETYRQKKRHEQLSEKEKEEEAKVAIRGFNEKILNNGKTASGEIDNSNLPKSFTFDIASGGTIIPNDGVCRVDYINADFRAKVFVVHKTRGMLLLRNKHVSSSKSSKKKRTVPGGKINEEEFLVAAKESGSPQVQLQIAAREAAARYVYETTGLDIRQQADRLKPAVLCMNPSMNSARGYQYLRNENEENLYYFLQVDESDFEKLKGEQDDDAAPTKLTKPSAEDPGDDDVPTKLERPSEDPGDEPLILKISDDYSGYEFVQDPVVASKVLKKDKNDAAIALGMIMSAATQEMNGPDSSQDNVDKSPDAKATEFSSKNDELDDEPEDKPKIETYITVGIEEDPKKSDDAKTFDEEEAKLNIKASGDTIDEMAGVTCCCSFWF